MYTSGFDTHGSFLPYDLAADRSQYFFYGPVEFTLGYSIYDFVFMAGWEPDFLFMAHHVAIFFCFAPHFFFESGYVIILTGIAIAEITNPLMLVWAWSRDNNKRKDLTDSERKWHTTTYTLLSTPFTFFYTLMRGIIMPLSLIDIGRMFFISGHRTIVLVWIWMFCVGGFAGSALWVHSLVSGYIKYLSKKSKKKSL